MRQFRRIVTKTNMKGYSNMPEILDSAQKMAKRAVALKFEDLSAKEVAYAKQSIMDCIGVMIAGATLGGKSKDVVNMMIEQGGKEEATIFGTGKKVPLESAAVANGGLAHTLDYDDAVDETGCHPTAAVLPSTLAVCEAEHRSGKTLIEAVTVGSDMNTRMGLTSPKTIIEFGWLGPQMKGAWAAVAGAAKAYGFDYETTVNAYGLMLQQNSGTTQVLDEGGNDCRELYQCFAQKDGIFAAILAKNGIRGPKQIFNGKHGLFNQFYEGRGTTDYSFVDVKEGDPWLTTMAIYKAWSSCRCTHGFIDGLRILMRENGFTGADIASVKCGVGKLGVNLCQPKEVRYAPAVGADARFSIPFTVGCTLTYGNVTLANFTDEGISDEKVLKTIEEKFNWYADEELLNDPNGVEGAKIYVTLKDGREFYYLNTDPIGGTNNPMTQDDMIAKFKDCCSHAAKPMSEETVNKLIDLCLHLEDVADVNEIIDLVR